MIPVNPRAWAWEALRGITHARPGTIFVGPTGETVRLRDDGGADPWPPDGRRSIASDPTAVRSAEAAPVLRQGGSR